MLIYLDELVGINVSVVYVFQSEAHNTRLFNHLKTTWEFAPGHKDMPSTCCLNFTVSLSVTQLCLDDSIQRSLNNI